MIPLAPFGRTGHKSTRTIFGSAALASVTQQEADHTLKLLLKYGINHIDTAASYGDAESRIGPWMKDYRDQFFWPLKQKNDPIGKLKMNCIDQWIYLKLILSIYGKCICW